MPPDKQISSSINEFQAHEDSHDHQHRKRMKELRDIMQESEAISEASGPDNKAKEGTDMKPMSEPVKKKPKYKTTLQPHNAAALEKIKARSSSSGASADQGVSNDPSGAIANGWADQAYNPRLPTGCGDGECPDCHDQPIDIGPPEGEK